MASREAAERLLGPGLQRAYDVGRAFRAHIDSTSPPDAKPVYADTTGERPGTNPEEDPMPETVQQTDPTPSVLTGREAGAIRTAFMSMPYAAEPRVMGLIKPSGTQHRDDLAVRDVVAALDALGTVLREAVEENGRVKRDHAQLVADVRSTRRVLGTEGIMRDRL